MFQGSQILGSHRQQAAGSNSVMTTNRPFHDGVAGNRSPALANGQTMQPPGVVGDAAQGTQAPDLGGPMTHTSEHPARIVSEWQRHPPL